MWKSKYIVIDQGSSELPFVFSELIQHAELAFALGGVDKVVGAGFCYISEDRYVCYGESISCKVKSRNEVDSKILNRLLGAEQ